VTFEYPPKRLSHAPCNVLAIYDSAYGGYRCPMCRRIIPFFNDVNFATYGKKQPKPVVSSTEGA